MTLKKSAASEFTGAVHSHLGIMSGTPVFFGTRVPVMALFDYVSSKEGIEEFLVDFPTVDREQALAVLELAARLVNEHAYMLDKHELTSSALTMRGVE